MNAGVFVLRQMPGLSESTRDHAINGFHLNPRNDNLAKCISFGDTNATDCAGLLFWNMNSRRNDEHVATGHQRLSHIQRNLIS